VAVSETVASESQMELDTKTYWLSDRQSWCQAPSGAHDQIFITVWQLQSCFLWGAVSDERTGLSFVHAAGPCQPSFLGSEYLGSRYHILHSRIWDFPFRRLLRLAGLRWR
jgi:hypothetical protein